MAGEEVGPPRGYRKYIPINGNTPPPPPRCNWCFK